MGACATKPKDLKDEMNQAPEPIPEVVKEENPEQLKKTDDGGVETTTKEIIDGKEDKKADDGSKTVSLNSLLMKSEPGKATVESEKPTETVSIPSVPVIEAVKVEETSKVEVSSTETEKKPESAPVVVEAKEEPLKVESVEPLKDAKVVEKKDEPVTAVEVKGDVAVSK
ncbi:hypothetical protein C5167_038849 [Papaver somniferum]|uniref:Uncharacterized protein n=1 Tax=Papaver somniferum TaxID=3469 RepID=A0A4Y7IAF7_PAPSO|nr:titin-like [Papaver somniferum]RZC45907.1 hypothetical protein C5167_038849 [Papaver somniferum]